MPTTERPGPVEPTESVYRRINVCYYTPGLELPVMPDAFKPTGSDGGGISVVRKGFTNEPRDALAGVDPAKLNLYHIAVLKVEEFLAQDLLVVEDAIIGKPDSPDIPGHALVPGLNTVDYKDRAKKKAMIDKMVALARIASGQIVHSPSATTPSTPSVPPVAPSPAV